MLLGSNKWFFSLWNVKPLWFSDVDLNVCVFYFVSFKVFKRNVFITHSSYYLLFTVLPYTSYLVATYPLLLNLSVK